MIDKVRYLGFDPNGFFKHLISSLVAFYLATKHIALVLFFTALKVGGTKLAMMLLVFVGDYYGWTNQGTIIGLALSMSIAGILVLLLFALYASLSYIQCFFVALPFPAFFGFIYLLFEMQDAKYLHPLIFSGLFIFVNCVACMIFSFFFITREESLDRVASRLARARAASGEDRNDEESEKKKVRSTKEILVLSVVFLAPTFVCLWFCSWIHIAGL